MWDARQTGRDSVKGRGAAHGEQNRHDAGRKEPGRNQEKSREMGREVGRE